MKSKVRKSNWFLLKDVVWVCCLGLCFFQLGKVKRSFSYKIKNTNNFTLINSHRKVNCLENLFAENEVIFFGKYNRKNWPYFFAHILHLSQFGEGCWLIFIAQVFFIALLNKQTLTNIEWIIYNYMFGLDYWDALLISPILNFLRIIRFRRTDEPNPKYRKA